MSEKFNAFLEETYLQFKNEPDPPIPLDLIEDYFRVEGIQLDKKENHD